MPMWRRVFMKVSMLFRVAVSATFLASGTAAAQLSAPRHTITHEDVWMMKRVGAPVVSPDGKWTVFSVTEPSYDESKPVRDLWIVPPGGSPAPRKLTNTKGGESGVEWSPEGSRIAFSARREDDSTSQIYVMNIAEGGEAARVTSVSTSASSPR